MLEANSPSIQTSVRSTVHRLQQDKARTDLEVVERTRGDIYV
jgi:hypothetical protein